MAVPFNGWYTPCNKSDTCKNKFEKCLYCNQTNERKGLMIFRDNKIQNYYLKINEVKIK